MEIIDEQKVETKSSRSMMIPMGAIFYNSISGKFYKIVGVNNVPYIDENGNEILFSITCEEVSEQEAKGINKN